MPIINNPRHTKCRFSTETILRKIFLLLNGNKGVTSLCIILSSINCDKAPVIAPIHEEKLLILISVLNHLIFSIQKVLFQILKPNSQIGFPNVAQTIATIVTPKIV